MSGGRIGGFDPSQVGSIAAQVDEFDLAAQAPPGEDAAAVADPALAAHVWQAHAQELTSAALQTSPGQVDDDPTVGMPRDFWTMEEWYKDMPADVRVMDDSIDKAGDWFRSGCIAGVETPEMQAAAQEDRTRRLLGSMITLALVIRDPAATMDQIVRAADEADARLLDFAAKGDKRTRDLMASHYGRSALGGGAFGNDIAGALLAAMMRQATGADQAPPPPPVSQVGGTEGTGPAPAEQKAPAAQTGGVKAPEGKAPAGYGSLDSARTGNYVRSGSSGSRANALIRALNAAGAKPPLKLDGKIGPDDVRAIKAFQARTGCAVDGIVGPETMGALDRALGLPVKSRKGVPAGPPAGQAPVGQVPAPPPGSAKGAGARRAALQAATTQIGVREASGNNDGVPAQRYIPGGRNVPWCAYFVAWSYRQAGRPLPGNQVAIGSCDAMASEMKKRGEFYGKSQTPQPGDIIFFGKPGDYTHVGIVERVSGGTVHTVEGNTGNRVGRRSYPIGSSHVQGFARPG